MPPESDESRPFPAIKAYKAGSITTPGPMLQRLDSEGLDSGGEPGGGSDGGTAGSIIGTACLDGDCTGEDTGEYLTPSNSA